jgi:hypothetical protein
MISFPQFETNTSADRIQFQLNSFGQMFSERPTAPTLRAIIDGQSRTFASVEQKFAVLAGMWQRHVRGKSIVSYAHPAYFQIVAMGWPVVPLLLREVSQGTGTWYPALQYITGEIADAPQDRGNPEAVRRAWLEWGKRNGHWSEPRKAQDND